MSSSSTHALLPSSSVLLRFRPTGIDRGSAARGGLTCSLPHDRLARPPPGRATGPWPCQSRRPARRAPSTCRRPAAGRARRSPRPSAGPGCGRPRGSSARTASVQRRRRPARWSRRPARSAQASRASASSREQLRPSGPGPRATPGPRHRSSAGSTSWRTRDPGEARVGVVRVVPRRQAQAAGRPVRSGPRRGRAAGGAAAARPAGHAGERAGARSRGRARAGPSRPGRRGCGRAGRRLRRAARRRASSAA